MKHRLVPQAVVCFLLALGSMPSPFAADRPAAKYADETWFIAELFRSDLLPRLNPGETCKMFSSYDRTRRKRRRFLGQVFEAPRGKRQQRLGRNGRPRLHPANALPAFRIRRARASWEEKASTFASISTAKRSPPSTCRWKTSSTESWKAFRKPLADVAIGGFYCYVPIPYKKSCKVVVDGTDVKFVSDRLSHVSDRQGNRDVPLSAHASRNAKRWRTP